MCMDKVGAVLLTSAQGGSHMGAADCWIAVVVEAEHQPESARRHAVFPLCAVDGPQLDDQVIQVSAFHDDGLV